MPIKTNNIDTLRRTVAAATPTAKLEDLEGRRLLAAAGAFPTTEPSLPDETVLFVNYDNGGEGVGYHDSDRRNVTGEYRRKDGVDLEWTADATAPDIGVAPGTGRAVGHTRAGEWLQYSVSIDTTDDYELDLRYAAGASGGSSHIEVDGKNVTGTLDLSGTGGWQAFRTLEKAGIALSAGQHTVRFVIDSGSDDVANLHWFRFITSSNGTDTPSEESDALAWPSTWVQTNDAPSPRYEAIAHTFNDNVYVFGGFKDADLDVDRSYAIYNPAINRWKTLGDLPAGMAESHITAADDGRFIYFVGGFAGDFQHDGAVPQKASDQAWRFDPARNRWTQLPRLPFATGAGGTAIVGDELHYMGGNSSDRVTNISNHLVLKLSDVDAGWTAARSMPDAKDHFSTLVLNGKIYTIGGEHGHDELFDTQASVYVYEPRRDRWKRLADLPIPVGHAEGSTFVYNGQIVIAGGQTVNQAATNRAFAYDPMTNRWSGLANLPAFRQGASISVVADRVVLALGARYTTEPLATTFVGLL